MVNPNFSLNHLAFLISSLLSNNLTQLSNPKALFKLYSLSPDTIASCLLDSTPFNIFFFTSSGVRDILNLYEYKCLMKISGLWKAFLIKCAIELIPCLYFSGFDNVSKVSNKPKLIALIFSFFVFVWSGKTLKVDIASNFIWFPNSKLSYLVDSFNLMV